MLSLHLGRLSLHVASLSLHVGGESEDASLARMLRNTTAPKIDGDHPSISGLLDASLTRMVRNTTAPNIDRGNWFAVSALFYASRLHWLTRASSALSENTGATAQADLSALKVCYRRIADPAGRELVRSGRFLELHAKPRSRKDLSRSLTLRQ